MKELKASILLSLRQSYDFFNNGFFLWIAAYFAKIHIIEPGTILKIFQITNSSTWVLALIGLLLPDISAAMAASKVVSKLLNYRPIIDVKSENGLKNPVLGRVEFSAVSFSYTRKTKNVLNCCNFILEPGQSLGITGRTGSGKSSIAMLLLRFYTVDSGFIFIDNTPIEDYNIAYLRSKIAWVSQEPVLFQGSIIDNMQLGNHSLTKEQALIALEKAQATDILEYYGMDSDVGVRGSFLSGGQKQRIAIARALARESPILILDESTSALDNTTEKNISDMLRNQGITLIIIAHRLDSIKMCDNIVIIDKGIVVQEGNHNELIRTDGLYRTLTKKMSLV